MKSVTVWIRFARRASPSTWAYLVPMEHRRTPDRTPSRLALTGDRPVTIHEPPEHRRPEQPRFTGGVLQARTVRYAERPPSVHRRSDVELKAGNCGMDAVDHIRAGRREFCCR